VVADQFEVGHSRAPCRMGAPPHPCADSRPCSRLAVWKAFSARCAETFRYEDGRIEDNCRMSKTIAGPDGKLRCRWCAAAPEFLAYHDTEWGFPVDDDHRLFEK